MRRSMLAVVLVILATAGFVWSGASTVKSATLWVVPWDYEGVIEARPGDVIEVWTRPLPVIPENLEARFRPSVSGDAVAYIGDVLPPKEGTMERLFFFKVFAPGEARLQVELVDGDGSVREVRCYQIEAAASAQ